MADYRDRSFRSHDGLEIAFRDYGRASGGVPLLCLPGVTRTARDEPVPAAPPNPPVPFTPEPFIPLSRDG